MAPVGGQESGRIGPLGTGGWRSQCLGPACASLTTLRWGHPDCHRQCRHAHFASNAWSNGASNSETPWQIPDPSRKSSLLQLVDDSVAIYRTQTAERSNWKYLASFTSSGLIQWNAVCAGTLGIRRPYRGGGNTATQWEMEHENPCAKAKPTSEARVIELCSVEHNNTWDESSPKSCPAPAAQNWQSSSTTDVTDSC